MNDKAIEKMTYEEGLKELEEIILALEANSGALEDMVIIFERGQALAKHCLAILDKAELRVETLAAPDVSDGIVL